MQTLKERKLTHGDETVFAEVGELSQLLTSKGEALQNGIKDLEALKFDTEDSVSAEELSRLMNLLGSDKMIANVVELDAHIVSHEHASQI